MPVHLIIDGYNLLGVRGRSGLPNHQEGEKLREELIKELSLYGQIKGHPLTVVFDAWRSPGAVGSREHRAGVEVVFSRSGEQADAVIKRLARQFQSDCAIVSSDHEIVNCAKDHGALVLTSQEFHVKLRAAFQGRSISKNIGLKRHKVTEKEDSDFPLRRVDKKGNPKKLPKAQRQRNRRLRGL